jgi:hypothetical protein
MRYGNRQPFNWVSLAQYFSTRQRYSASRALYQRVIRSYSKGGDHLYPEYARQALTDMDILALGQDTEQGLVAQPALSALQTAGTPSREGIELKPDHPPWASTEGAGGN